MFDVGFWELLLIGVVGLLVVGPERLPDVARTIGRWVGQAQRMVRSVRSDIERELETENLRSMLSQQEEEIQQLKGMVRDVKEDVESGVGAGTLKDEFTRMQQELDSPQAAPTPGDATSAAGEGDTTPGADAGVSDVGPAADDTARAEQGAGRNASNDLR